MKTRTIDTLDYGVLPIAKNKTYLCDEFLDIIEDTNSVSYEIRKTLNGQLVALQVGRLA